MALNGVNRAGPEGLGLRDHHSSGAANMYEDRFPINTTALSWSTLTWPLATGFWLLSSPYPWLPAGEC